MKTLSRTLPRLACGWLAFASPLALAGSIAVTTVVPTLSTVHRWFACARLLNTHLTGSCPAFSGLAHYLGHWTEAAAGGLNPDPATRVEGPTLISRAAGLLRSTQCMSTPSRRRGAQSSAQRSAALAERLQRSPSSAPRSGNADHESEFTEGIQRRLALKKQPQSALGRMSAALLRHRDRSGHVPPATVMRVLSEVTQADAVTSRSKHVPK